MGREERARTEEERAIRALEQFKRDYPLGILIDDSDKFTEETITKALAEWDRLEKLPRRPLILPGEGTKLPTGAGEAFHPHFERSERMLNETFPVLDAARGMREEARGGKLT
jgi:hypothetical protein